MASCPRKCKCGCDQGGLTYMCTVWQAIQACLSLLSNAGGKAWRWTESVTLYWSLRVHPAIMQYLSIPCPGRSTVARPRWQMAHRCFAGARRFSVCFIFVGTLKSLRTYSTYLLPRLDVKSFQIYLTHKSADLSLQLITKSLLLPLSKY